MKAEALLLLLALCGCTTTTQTDGPVETLSPGPSVLVLRADGLELDAGGQRQDLPFGAGTGVVVPALAEALGEPAQQPVTCPRGRRTAVTSKGLEVLFDGDVLVGWSTSAPGLATDSGLHVGSTDDDVRRALPRASFAPGSLGGRYTDGPLRVDVGDARTVLHLDAGDACDH